jgi:hypothetical protein
MHLFRTIPALLACAAILFAAAGQAGVREDQFAAICQHRQGNQHRALPVSLPSEAKPCTLKSSAAVSPTPRPAPPAMAKTHAAAAARPAARPSTRWPVSVTPARYTDPAKVEKWFKRNCTEVLGRVCTAQEKG